MEKYLEGEELSEEEIMMGFAYGLCPAKLFRLFAVLLLKTKAFKQF
jgi:hypothetical protein